MKRFFLITIFLIFFGSFVFRHLLSDPGIWNYGDANFPFNEVSFHNLGSLILNNWSDHEFFGYDTTYQGIPRLSFFLLISFFKLFSQDFSVIQFSWWVFIFVAAGIPFYYLVFYFSKNNLAAFTASILSPLNPFFLSRSLNTPLMCQAFAFIPLLILIFVKALDTKKNGYVFLFPLVLFFIIPSLHYTFMAFLFLGFYFIYRQINTKSLDERKILFLILSKLFLVSFFVLAFYTFPLVFSLFFDKGGNALEGLARRSVGDIGLYWGTNSRIFNIFRLLGYQDSLFDSHWSLRGFLKIIWEMSSLLLTGFLIFAIFSNKHKKLKDYLFFCFFLLFFIFVTNIGSVESRSIFRFLKFIPLSYDPTYYMYLVVIPYVILVAFGYSLFIKKLKIKTIYFVSYIFIFLLVCLNSYPILLWKDFRFMQVKYPQKYDQLNEFLNSDKDDYRVLLLPASWAVQYNWAPYMMNNWSGYALSKPFFGLAIYQSTSNEIINLSDAIIDAIKNNKKNLDLAAILGLANIKYVVIASDIYDDFDVNRMESVINNFKSQENITFLKNYDGVLLFKVKEEFLLPKFYLTDKFNASDSDINEFLSSGGNSSPVCSVEKENNFYNCNSGKFDDLKLQYSKVNSSNYLIYAKNDGDLEKSLLVFNNSFDHNWKANLVSSPEDIGTINLFMKKGLSHLKVNGFANGWVLDKEYYNSKGELIISLNYLPDKIYRVGIRVSLGSLITIIISVIIFFFISFFKRLRNKNED